MDYSVNNVLIRTVTEIHREGRRSFRDQEWTSLHNWCTGESTNEELVDNDISGVD